MRARRMRRRSLAVAAVAVCAAVGLAGASPVSAGDRLPGLPGEGDDDTGGGSGGSGGGEIGEDGDPTAIAGTPGTPGSSTPGSDGDDGEPECWFEVVVADDMNVTVYDQFGNRRFSETGRWLMQVCEGIGPVATNGWPVFPEGGSVDPGELAEQARESVPIGAPSAVTSPAVGRLVVQMPTWLWVDGSWWQEYSATATAGRVSSTVTATPQRAVWTTGDGATVECGAGTPWHAGLADSEATCSHIYRQVSPPGGFELSVTVEFAVGWESNVGESGSLSTISRSASQVVQVGEIQAIGTR